VARQCAIRSALPGGAPWGAPCLSRPESAAPRDLLLGLDVGPALGCPGAVGPRPARCSYGAYPALLGRLGELALLGRLGELALPVDARRVAALLHLRMHLAGYFLLLALALQLDPVMYKNSIGAFQAAARW
jgi:hypothetical protein